MRISEICQQTGMTKDAIRYYEDLGFLENINRTENGYKQYTPAHVEQLILLKRTKAFGFTLKEIKTLAELFLSKTLTEDVMTQHLRKKEQEIDESITQLMKYKSEIKRTLSGGCEHSDQLKKTLKEISNG